MVPMQATCFSSAEEIRLTSQALLTKLFAPKDYKTFAISIKRRICSNVTRKEIIDIVGDIVSEMNPKCKVDLDNPEATIVVEICRTLCGISVVPKCHEFHNFSLVTAREGTSEAEKKSET
jgi:tRNA acetyltransferase TAN1